MRKLTRLDVGVPLLLLALSLVPTLGGIVRLARLSDVAPAVPEDARFLDAPGPVSIHVISATLFCLVGAFQFSSGFRVRWPQWHRRAGRALALFGLLAGASGMWMTSFYAIPASLQGPLLYGVRLAVGLGMVASLLAAWRTILRGDVPRHEAFMIRAYALGQGAGTQALVLLPWMLISGESDGHTRDLLMTLSWLINLMVGESIIRARSARRGLAPGCAGESADAGSPRSIVAPSRRPRASRPQRGHRLDQPGET